MAKNKGLTPEEEANQLKQQIKEIQKQATAKKKRLAAKRMKLMAESAEDYKNQLDKVTKEFDSYKSQVNQSVERLSKISQLTNFDLVSCDDVNFDNAFSFLRNSVEMRKARNQKKQN